MSASFAPWSTRHPHAYAYILNMCTLGYRSPAVQSFFTAFQPLVFSPLKTILEFSHACKGSPAVLMSMITPPHHFTTDVNHEMEKECAMWQLQNKCGYLQLTYDPSTGERIHVALNDLQSDMLGMHRDELTSRFAAHDEPLCIPLQDLLLLIADDALRGFADGPRHYRTFLHKTRTPALVCVSTERNHDAAGRLVTVRARQRKRHRHGHVWDTRKSAWGLITVGNRAPGAGGLTVGGSEGAREGCMGGWLKKSRQHMPRCAHASHGRMHAIQCPRISS
jgi:hypothetical protein